MKEIWADIKKFEGYYQVSSFGRIKSMSRIVKGIHASGHPIKEKILKTSKDNKGYPTVGLLKDGKRYAVKVHRLVALAFIPNNLNKREVNHKNSIRHDNNVENLEWCTRSENILHAYKHGNKKQKTGEYHPMYGKRGKLSPLHGKTSGAAKIVLDLQTGIFYDSAKKAAESKNIGYGSLMSQLNGGSKNKTSFIYV